MKDSTKRILYSFRNAVIGLLYAFLIWFLAFLMTGAGHGWGSGGVSGLGIFVIPIFGIGVANRDSKGGLICLIFSVVAMIGVDIWIWQATESEGTDYFWKAWRHAREILILWLLFWATWQIAAVKILIQTLRARSRSKI